MFSTGVPTCDAMKELNLQGNIIPHAWYKTIIKKDLKNPRPHLLAISILSDIVYWYRPTEVRDEYTGELRGYNKRFHSDLLQRSYDNITNQFGCTYDMAKDALVFLEKLGVIKRVFRDENRNGTKVCNIMYLSLNVDRLKELTYPHTENRSNNASTTSSEHPGKFTRTSGEIHPDPAGKFTRRGEEISSYPTGKNTRTNTKNTTQNTTKNTHSIDQHSPKNAQAAQIQMDGVSDSEILDFVIDDLETKEEIPYSYSTTPQLMRAAIDYLCEYDHHIQHILTDDKQNAFELCVDCLTEMACDHKAQTYRGARISYTQVIDAINKHSNRCSEGGLNEFILEAVDDLIAAEKNTPIKNIRKYTKTLLWSGFSTYKVKIDALFNRTFDGPGTEKERKNYTR